jgi:hypothetical protein
MDFMEQVGNAAKTAMAWIRSALLVLGGKPVYLLVLRNRVMAVDRESAWHWVRVTGTTVIRIRFPSIVPEMWGLGSAMWLAASRLQELPQLPGVKETPASF